MIKAKRIIVLLAFSVLIVPSYSKGDQTIRKRFEDIYAELESARESGDSGKYFSYFAPEYRGVDANGNIHSLNEEKKQIFSPAADKNWKHEKVILSTRIEGPVTKVEWRDVITKENGNVNGEPKKMEITTISTHTWGKEVGNGFC